MHVRCPHCRNPIELVDDDPLSEVVCPSCGSGFSLIADETVSYPQGAHERIGHFELLERVGIGAFGTVWKARDTELDRTVAIKIPRQGQIDSKERETFLREARAAAQLRHPGIVGVHEVGRENDTIYIVSDYVQGVPLSSRLTAGPVTVREAAEMCAKIADALQHAHEAGVIHRDVKPSNIIIDDEGEPHITDFGLAKRDAGEITITVDGNILGTPAYMSPEQASGTSHAADSRSDVYSVGVILYELITDEKPFRGDRRMLLHQVINDDPPSPRKLNSNVPRDIETICLKCIEKEPDRRYGSCRELSDDLRRFLNGEPTHARPVGPFRRLWRLYRRHAVEVAAATALFLSLSIAIMLVPSLIYNTMRTGAFDFGNALFIVVAMFNMWLGFEAVRGRHYALLITAALYCFWTIGAWNVGVTDVWRMLEQEGFVSFASWSTTSIFVDYRPLIVRNVVQDAITALVPTGCFAMQVYACKMARRQEA